MDILYDHSALCDLCHHPSRFGFLYKCGQDNYIDQATQRYQREYPDPSAIHDSTTEQLRAINMSASVIQQFEKGTVYSPLQIEQLMNQKTKMLDVLAKHQARLPVIPKCALKCCPTCRPYLRDRVPYALESIFAHEVEPIQPEKEQLPIKNAKRMLQLGLKPVAQVPPPPPVTAPSTATTITSDDDDDDISISDDDDDGADDEEEEMAEIRSSDGAAVTEESVEMAIPDVVEVNSVPFHLQSINRLY
jgi:hypothetical protein